MGVGCGQRFEATAKQNKIVKPYIYVCKVKVT